MLQHVAKKRFGQNFLVDAAAIQQIISAIALQAEDRLVEIGPGRAALTERLLAKVDSLLAIEIDRDLVAYLRARFGERLQIFVGDALNFDFSTLVHQPHSLRVVGNLPYNISTPLLFHLAEFREQICDCHVMLQKEVVERIVAAPGHSDYGRLSVMMQYLFDCEQLFIIPPESFQPVPKVYSAFMRLTPKPAAALTAPAEFFATVVRAAFSQRRKMIRNTLKNYVDEATLRMLNLNPLARAEDLSVADYIRLSLWIEAQAKCAPDQNHKI